MSERWMSERIGVGKEGCRNGGMLERRDAGMEGCRNGGMQERKDAGKEVKIYYSLT